MKEIIIDLVKRNIAIIVLFLIGIIVPAFVGRMSVEFKTIFLIIAFESIAMLLSNVAHFVYTKLDFTNGEDKSALARIFVGVHILVGLSVYSIYMLEGIKSTVLP